MIPRAAWHWDGEWHWPTSLIHYIEKHSVRLPDRMVKHIEENKFQPPTSITHVPYEQLPMPAVPQMPKRSFLDWLKEKFGCGYGNTR